MLYLKIFVISDIHGETRYLDSAAGFFRSSDLVVVCGDFANAGGRRSAADILASIERHTRAILAVHGNRDEGDVRELLNHRGYGLHACGRVVGGVGFFGVGGSGRTLFKTPGEYSYAEFHEFLRSGYREVSSAKKTVLVSHCPPRGTRDRTILGLRGGCAAVKEFIEKNRIELCLTGHIHEAFGVELVHGCTVVNSGTFKKGNYSYIEIGDSMAVEQGKLRI